MGRKPDRTEQKTWRGRPLIVRLWAEPSYVEWDGEGDEPDEGWDVKVEVEVKIEQFIFIGEDTNCGIYFGVDRWITNEGLPNAIADLELRIEMTAEGCEVTEADLELRRARRRQVMAKWLDDAMKKGVI